MTCEGKTNTFDFGGDKIKGDAMTRMVGGKQTMKKYTIFVKTTDQRWAGTDNKVSIDVAGVNGQSGMQTLDNTYGNDFEQGKEDEFELELPDLGALTEVTLESHGFDTWKCDWVKIICEGQKTAFFDFNGVKIDDEGVTRKAGEMAKIQTKFVGTIHTANEYGAGTDAKCDIWFTDSTGRVAGPVEIGADKDAMERGSEEKINIALVDELSGLSKLQIRQVQIVFYIDSNFKTIKYIEQPRTR